jgi:hypothetical protein
MRAVFYRVLSVLRCLLPQVHLAMALRRREAYVESQAATIKLTCHYKVRHIPLV